jgi:excinuclease ABC subunit B
MGFRLAVNYQPRGDQQQAIEQLVRGVLEGEPHQVLLGVTGSGKTFTIAKVIEETVPAGASCMAHNKIAGGAALPGIQVFFPSQRGRILCKLLRLLPAGSVHTGHGHLYRERGHDQ